MAGKTLYTALGHFRCRHDKGRRYPVILMDHHEFGMDPQEMTLWTALCWRLTERQRAEDFYEQLSNGMELFPRRSFSDCLDRLVTRGLVAKGSGTTDFDALYDLLGGLYARSAHGAGAVRYGAQRPHTSIHGGVGSMRGTRRPGYRQRPANA